MPKEQEMGDSCLAPSYLLEREMKIETLLEDEKHFVEDLKYEINRKA